MLKEETIEFLQKIPPFNLLTPEDMDALVADISLEYYPKGVKILTQGGPPSDFLRVIKKGGTKVYVTSDDREEIIIDYRSEGEQFGFISMVSEDRSRANIVAVEDTICYLIPRDKVLAIMQKTPEASEYYVKSFFLNFIDKTHDETRRRFTSMSDSDRLLFTVPVGSIVRRAPITTEEDSTIQDAAKLMAHEKISSIIVVNDTNVPVGIVTDRDLREKVVAKGRDLHDSISTIMNAPLIKVDADEYCFEALLKMIRYKIHHIIVVDNGVFTGVLTNHDFMVLQGSSPTVLVKEMEDIQSLDNLHATTPKLYRTIASLLKEGARAHNITGLTTELIEKLLNRIIEITEKEIGGAPVNYSMFFYGNGGRRELTLKIDLTLGIVYEDTNNMNTIKNAEQYFGELARKINDALTACGISIGKQSLDLDNVHSFSDWKHLFGTWAAEPFRLMPRVGFFDIRALRGDDTNVIALKNHLIELAASNEDFMNFIAVKTVENRPPLGFFKKFVVDKSGEHRNELDIYQKGIKPLVNVVRLLCIERGIKDVPTMRRLKTLRNRYRIKDSENIEHALDYLGTLLMHNQIRQIEEGLRPDNFINPETLTGIEKNTMKESFQLAANLYELIEKKYNTERER